MKGEPGKAGQPAEGGGAGGKGGEGGAGGKGHPEGGGGLGGSGGVGGAGGLGTGLRARLARPHLTLVDLLCAAGSIAALVLLLIYTVNGHL